jgi:hypothetical protein
VSGIMGLESGMHESTLTPFVFHLPLVTSDTCSAGGNEFFASPSVQTSEGDSVLLLVSLFSVQNMYAKPEKVTSSPQEIEGGKGGDVI